MCERFKVALYWEESGIRGSNYRRGKVGPLRSSVRHTEETPRPGPGPNPTTGSDPGPPHPHPRSTTRSTTSTSQKQNCSVEKLLPPLRPESSTLSNQLHFRNTSHADCTSFLLNPVTSQRIMGCCKCPPTQQRPTEAGGLLLISAQKVLTAPSKHTLLLLGISSQLLSRMVVKVTSSGSAKRALGDVRHGL